MTGQTIGHYRIGEKIGAGGMGVVYRATDTKLNRDVALKVLPEEFARDAQRMARFEREAQVLASLNHPNIAAIYGLEQKGEVRALALELVEGPTLADRIKEGPLPLEEALNIARQIAEALEEAHERGVMHRDLKPANVKVTPEGKVKVLDFGLAKALEGETAAVDLSRSPTLSVAATQAGIILGTAAYMSPEQARGHRADRRADIWSFGAVLFEMLTGRQLFTGETVSDTLAAVLRAEAGWDALPKNTPPAIHKLLRRCLTRDPKRRLQAIGDARLELDEVALTDETTETTALHPFWRRQRLWWAASLVVAVALAAALGWGLRPSPPETQPGKFLLGFEVPGDPGGGSPTSISPDGRRVVFSSQGRLWVRDMTQLTPREIRGTQDAQNPFWSPDSRSFAYAAKGKLWRVAAAGGESTVICDLPGGFQGGAWGADDLIAFNQLRGPMFTVSARGGDPQVLLPLGPEKEVDFHQPVFLPDGRTLIYSVHRRGAVDTVEAYRDGQRKVLFRLEGEVYTDPQVVNHPRYSPTGHLLYRREKGTRGIWAVPFSPSRLEITGEPFLVVPDGTYPSISNNETLVYMQMPASGADQLVWVNRRGEVEGTIGKPQPDLRDPTLSPDGSRVAVAARETDNYDIWIHDVASGSLTRLTFTPTDEWSPSWSPDGSQLIFTCGPARQESICRAKADGTGTVEKLVQGFDGRFSRDGKYVVYVATQGENEAGTWEGASDIWYLPLDGEREPRVIVQTEGDDYSPRLSPDGSFLVYESDEREQIALYVTRFPSGQGKWQVYAGDSGYSPRWSPQGNEIIYWENRKNALVGAPWRTRPVISPGTPRVVFSLSGSGLTLALGSGFEMTPDGRRFLATQSVQQEAQPPAIIVVENWFAEFQGRQ